jgi:F420-0:gamma-glutamyl ligase-like protein
MHRPTVRAISTGFWRPGENFSEQIINSIENRIRDGDMLVLSEKAISTSSSNIVDESVVKVGLSARIIADLWMPIMWGCFLGRICRFKPRLIAHLSKYPSEEGSRHKQIALQYAGLFQALMFGSEGGIDGSNLAYSYVSLSLPDAYHSAGQIREQIWSKLEKNVSVMISDTDKTYSFGNFHFTPRPNPMKGIHSFGGFFTFVAARLLMLKRRATPLAVVGVKMSVETALEIAEAANHARGFGAGKTVWDMAAKFNVALAEVSWEMLEAVKHKPIVIVRN